MKKKSITLGVLFCILILSSLTYQPIVANETFKDKSNQSDIELYDCGCEDESKSLWPFPFLCTILNMFRFIGIFIFLVTQDLHFLNSVLDIAVELDCNWLPNSL